MAKLNIANYIITEDKTVNFAELTSNQKKMIANKLTENAFTSVGYKKARKD